MKVTGYILILMMLALTTAAQNDTIPKDTLIVDTVTVDSTVVDTLEGAVIAPCETCPQAESAPTDSSNQSAWVAERMKERQEAITDSSEIWKPISFHDTLSAAILSNRLNQRRWLKMAWYHDAGDYFRSDPAYLVTDYQVTPMRKTVQPFGLSGDRMNVITDAFSIRPFDHPIEPDGMFDFNDIPTALDNDVYLMPGATGMLFGGERAVASLITRPQRETGNDPLVRFKVDKGEFAYSYARASYNKMFANGRKIDMSIGYRNADGWTSRQYEDAYHYYGDFLSPLGGQYSMRLSGRLYDRGSPLLVRPDSGGQSSNRVRIDREGKVTINRLDRSRNAQTSLTYTHLRQASRYTSRYIADYNYTGNGAELSRQWNNGNSLWDFSIGADYLIYAPESRRFYRTTGKASLRWIKRNEGSSFSVKAGAHYDRDFRLLPSAVALFKTENDRHLLMLSVGYTDRAPKLDELYQPYHSSQIYSNVSIDYADMGNKNLVSEKELVGSLIYELGDTLTSARLSITGGQILDGINYRADATSGITLFSPSNADITFASISTNERLRLGSFMALLGGGAYNYQKHDDLDNVPYAPEYQLFSGGEINLLWRQKDLRFFAYGEVVYVGPYDGYIDTGLGETALFNAKLSMQMRSFRFFYVFQNPISTIDLPRDQFLGIGRYFYYGFTWDFLK